ncbi:hypothetical protein ABK040_000109 [Willaertia magna]
MEVDSEAYEQVLVKELQNFRFGSSSIDEESNQNDISQWRLSDFEFLKIIGEGTFGCVRIVKRFNQYYAMKIIKKIDIIKLKQISHIKQERDILLLNDMNHPFIIKLYQTFQDENYLYFVFDYTNGGELFTHLRTHDRFPAEMVKFYAAEIILALQHVHKRNIAYRDLKPENILLDSDGHVKLIDFGFAKIIPETTNRTWTTCGTPEYMAPEIIQQKGHGKGVDYWALGILIYEMLVGYPPFNDENIMDLYDSILHNQVTFPNFLDPLVIDLISKLLNKDRLHRLGCSTRNGIEDIKNHEWFKGIDWVKLELKQYAPPLKIKLTDIEDCRYLEEYEEPKDGSIHHTGKVTNSLTPQQQALFEGF